MRNKLLYFILAAQVISSAACSQDLGNLLKNVTAGAANSQGAPTTVEVANGLKEALSNGVQKGTTQLSSVNGFFANAAVKILMPPDAQKVVSTLRSIGLGKQVDDAILSMNRAAEDATKSAAPIFMDAIKQMSIQDAWGILKGSDTAATAYLRNKTTLELTNSFTPVIRKSLDRVDATKYWNTLFESYNKLPFVTRVNPDLSAYVTQKALSGIFYEIGQEEIAIRKNPVERTSDLLKKVFGK